jgi:CRP-like cAMP-binding protein
VTTLVRIPALILRELVYSDGRLAIGFISVLDRRHREALWRLESATMLPTRERIADLLRSFLARNVRSRAVGEVNLSQDEIASMLGMRRQVVNRALREMEQDGIVQVHYGRLTVVDMAKLSALAPAYERPE